MLVKSYLRSQALVIIFADLCGRGGQISPGKYLDIEVPINPVAGPSRISAQDCSQTDPSARVSYWHSAFKQDAYELNDHLLRLKYYTLEDDSRLLRSRDSPAAKYVEPALQVATGYLLKEDLPLLEFEECQNNDGIPYRVQGSVVVPENVVEKLSSLPQTIHMCFMSFVTPGLVRWDQLRQCLDSCRVSRLNCDALTKHLILDLREKCEQNSCPFAVLTDGVESAILNLNLRLPGPDSGRRLPLEIHPVTKYSVRRLLTQRIWAAARELGLLRKWPKDDPLSCQGAVNNPTLPPPLLPDLLSTCRSFSDFDFYTLQRDSRFWLAFFQWKKMVSAHASTNRICEGDTLRLAPHAFQQYNHVWRSPFPNHNVPKNTRRRIKRAPRSRNLAVDDLLAFKRAVQFRITSVKRSGPEYFSQVCFGYFPGIPQVLCVKLFDERCFPIPKYNDYFVDDDPSKRLLSLHYAEDMVRREEGAYDRMKHLQGTLIPHCYGFHRFTLPDGWQVYGLVMEAIEGSSLWNINLPSLKEPVQRDIITQIRHGVRALKFAGIEQTDWHADQILCFPSPVMPGSFEIVFIDFAFTCQRYGEHWGCPPTMDVWRLTATLSFDMGLRDLVEELWLPALEEER